MYKPLHPDFWGNRKPLGQVDVDYSNPIARGLIKGWIFNQEKSGESDIVDGTPPTNDNFPPKAIQEGQKVLSCDGSNGLIEINPPEVMAGNNNYTVVIRSAADRYETGHVAFVIRDGVLTSGILSIYPYDTGDHARVYIDGSTELNGSVSSIADGKMHDLVLVVRSSTDKELYQDCISVATSSASGAMTSTPTALGVGAWRDAIQPFHGQISHVYLFDRDLTLEEIKSINENPYQILKPTTNYFIVPADAGAAPTFQPAWAREANILL